MYCCMLDCLQSCWLAMPWSNQLLNCVHEVEKPALQFLNRLKHLFSFIFALSLHGITIFFCVELAYFNYSFGFLQHWTFTYFGNSALSHHSTVATLFHVLPDHYFNIHVIAAAVNLMHLWHCRTSLFSHLHHGILPFFCHHTDKCGYDIKAYVYALKLQTLDCTYTSK